MTFGSSINLSTSELTKNPNKAMANKLLKDGASLNNRAQVMNVFKNSISSAAKTKDAGNITDRQQMVLDQSATGMSFFGSIFSASKTASSENREQYIKNAIDVDGNGEFDKNDTALIDIDKDGSISGEEMEEHLKNTYKKTEVKHPSETKKSIMHSSVNQYEFLEQFKTDPESKTKGLDLTL